MRKMIETFKMLKEKHSDALILFRVGDFYESYFEDAKKVSEVLGVTLTENEKDDIFITSFPTQSLDTYLPKLIRAGLRVAICDDISEPIKLKKRGSNETTQESQVEDADAEEIKTEEPQQEKEEPKHYSTVYTPENGKWLCEPNNGRTFELEEMQKIVGGNIELVRLNDGRIIVVNEDGLNLNLPVNIEATNILRRDHSTTQYIVGTAIVCDADMIE